MTRVNTRTELFKAIAEVGVFRDTSGGGSSTSTGTQPTVGAKSVINAVSGTGFTGGDWFRVGSLLGKPQINRVDSILTNAITPRLTWRHTVAVGDAIVEQTQVPLRHLAGPPRLTFSGSQNVVHAEERELAIGYLLGTMKAELAFDVLPYNLNNIALTLGMRDADSAENIAGSGTIAAPHRMFINGSVLRELGTLCWYVTGTTQGGRTLTIVFTGCEINPSALKHGIQRGTKQAIPFRLVPTTGILFLEVD
jgi:hypothetical protein